MNDPAFSVLGLNTPAKTPGPENAALSVGYPNNNSEESLLQTTKGGFVKPAASVSHDVIDCIALSPQPKLSVTVTRYVPGYNVFALAVVCKRESSHKKL